MSLAERYRIFLNDLKTLRKSVRASERDRVSTKALRDEAERLGKAWFAELMDEAKEELQCAAPVVEKYSTLFRRLKKISAPNNRKSSYEEVLGAIIKDFAGELLVVAEEQVGSGSKPSLFEAFVAGLADPMESEYFQEALACAHKGHLRAAAVIGWCAAIDRIHRRIEVGGFAAFNTASAQMASETVGRFKRFNQPQKVTSLSELREVFDTVVLWIIEGMNLIDINEHTRLRSCFELRCQCAHPGEAPVTEYNLMSFFSDIQRIVLQNPKFSAGTIGSGSP